MSRSDFQIERARFSWLPKSTRHALKTWRKRVRIAWSKRFRSFDSFDLLEQLQWLGVRPGQVIAVHSSFDRFAGFAGKPSEVIEILQKAVGPTGTILMPTFPFTGSAVDYARYAPIFDLLRTPSKMGLITEVFRRSPGVLRSLHPTHSVAAWGARAAEMISDHLRAATPCGFGSPFAKLLDCEGKILLLGTGISAMTFYHTIEELLEPELPFSPFTAEQFTFTCRDASGSLVTSTMRLFDPRYSTRRNLKKLEPVLRKRGAWRRGRVGSLDTILLEAHAVLEACRFMARQKTYCYDE
jgi:aminoglycoside 3-N-acetyltransferase